MPQIDLLRGLRKDRERVEAELKEIERRGIHPWQMSRKYKQEFLLGELMTLNRLIDAVEQYEGTEGMDVEPPSSPFLIRISPERAMHFLNPRNQTEKKDRFRLWWREHQNFLVVSTYRLPPADQIFSTEWYLEEIIDCCFLEDDGVAS